MAMGGRDRHPAEDGPTLGARALMNAVEELCRSRGLVGIRTADRVLSMGDESA
jgi:hypothetical protein